MADSFFWQGPKAIQSPLILSVPHAGRLYPPAMAQQCRLSPDALMVLEDRHSDALVAAAVNGGHHAITASIARAWIDLNRAEDEIDPMMLRAEERADMTTRSSPKVRGGLGLIPRRIAKEGDLWKMPLSCDDVQNRIATVHRPYHDAIEAALEDRVRRYGTAILLDIHTMPPLKAELGAPAAHIVVGDLFRRSAHPRFTDQVLAEAQAAGFRVALNAPYAGGFLLERHARPHQGIHALQIEIDRSLYLDSDLKNIGPGAAVIDQLVRRLADAVSDETRDAAQPLAAE